MTHEILHKDLLSVSEVHELFVTSDALALFYKALIDLTSQASKSTRNDQAKDVEAIILTLENKNSRRILGEQLDLVLGILTEERNSSHLASYLWGIYVSLE